MYIGFPGRLVFHHHHGHVSSMQSFLKNILNSLLEKTWRPSILDCLLGGGACASVLHVVLLSIASSVGGGVGGPSD
jgi:hypothetical protein